MKNRLKSFYQLKAVGDIRQVGIMVEIGRVKDRTRELFDQGKDWCHVIECARKRSHFATPRVVIVLMPPLAMTIKRSTNYLI